MPSKPTDPREVRVILDEHGTATLSGLNYQDLRSILTAASLHNYDGQRAWKADIPEGDLAEVIHENNLDDLKWWHDHRLIIDVADAQMAEAIRPGYSDGLPAIEFALKRHGWQMERLEEDVREAEKKAALPGATSKVDDARAALEEIRAALPRLEKLSSGYTGEGQE